jgi:hypothetical protein
VLLTVSVAVAGEAAVTFTEEGESVQAKLACVVEQLRVTVPVNPAKEAVLIVEVPDCPGAEMLMVLGFADTLKSVTAIVATAEVEPA